MRLDRIVLNGFKSFADKTEFRFDYPITGIVGPNGCGKSNVVDAIKWVLGEQSVKSLRSDRMADVIFSGSSSRKRMGTAEVSLFLSQTKGQLSLETDEVEITRRIYQSGESEYMMNNKQCRLKDIRELLMDTGLGAKAYSIIEQGQIEQLLTASKEDRRYIFEEAAGISKYKAHRKEAIRKLERTEENLLRLADILGEVQRQLRSVKLQAGKARNYLEYSRRLKELQVNYSLVEYHKIDSQKKEKVKALGQVEQRFGAAAAEVSRNEALLSRLGQEIIEAENDLNRADNSLAAVQSKIEQDVQRIEFLRARVSELAERRKDAAERIAKLREQKGGFESDFGRYERELAECEQALAERIRETEKLQESIQQTGVQVTSMEAELEDEKSGIIDIVRRTAQLHNEIQSISVYRDNLASQKNRLCGRANTSRQELEGLLTEKAQYQARLDDVEKVLEQLSNNLNAKRGQTQQIEGRIESGQKQLAGSKEARSALSSELSVLTDMDRRREGLNVAVKEIVESGRFDYAEGVLADIVEADIEYADAVEAALEGRTDWVIANSSVALLANIEEIKRLDGRVSFICMDKVEPFCDQTDLTHIEGVIGRLVEFVRFKSRYSGVVWHLLGRTIVADSLARAVEICGRVASDYRIVTLAGELAGSAGVIKVGPVGRTTGLISRKSRLRQLQETVENISVEIARLQEQLEADSREKAHLEKLCKDLRTAIYEANTEKTQIGSKLSALEQNIARVGQEEPLIAGEIEILEQQIAESVQREYNSKQKLEELEAVDAERKKRIEQLQSRHAALKAEQQAQMGSLTDSKVAVGQAGEQSRSIRQVLASMESQMRANAEAEDAVQSEAANCGRQSEQAQSDILRCESQVCELFAQRETSEQTSRKLHEDVGAMLDRQKQTEQLIRQKRAEQSGIDQELNQLKLELGQLEVKVEDLVQRVKDELEIDLAEAYKNYSDQEIDWDKVRAEIGELRGKIERLGNVNLDAIGEQDDLEKRNEFLSSQVADLNQSKSQLHQLINRLNKKSREQFQETFEQIRLGFQELFRKLFGGGRADIILEESEDILEAGIEIVARPPGKEPRSISLLSGGEKSLTAVALLFSVFKAKPSPFCLLDEVDAALDEANNERFNMMIGEFSKHSQFVVITHSKRTMSIADVLFGVTMQTRGVSKKISVRFEEYKPQEQAAAVA